MHFMACCSEPPVVRNIACLSCGNLGCSLDALTCAMRRLDDLHDECDQLVEENDRLRRELTARGLGWVITNTLQEAVMEEQNQQQAEQTEKHECTCGARERRRADNKRAAEIQASAFKRGSLDF